MMMAPAHKSHQACVQFSDPVAPEGVQVSKPTFLEQCRASALARFPSPRGGATGCLTVEHPVPPKPGDEDSTGNIVAHISLEACTAWKAGLPPTVRDKPGHIDAQVQLVLEDLADQDMHGYLAFTEAQCAIYSPDLVQLIHEGLERTTFSSLGREADCHWEGTLVGRVTPPYLVLVVSIGLAGQAGPRKTPKPVTRRGRKPGTVGGRKKAAPRAPPSKAG